MRLRPSGRQGPVATALAAFTAYQQTEAWTWEHLALTRARPVAGDRRRSASDVEAFRRSCCGPAVRRPKVLADVAEMRARIAAGEGRGGGWDLKVGPGGVQDIELLAQAGGADRRPPGARNRRATRRRRRRRAG